MLVRCPACRKSVDKLFNLLAPVATTTGTNQAVTESLCAGCVLGRLGITDPPLYPDVILNRRSDLSTFVVHLCREQETKTAREAIKEILGAAQPVIKAGKGSGIFASNDWDGHTKAVCFTEMPLEHIYSFASPMRGRQYNFKRYGVMFSKDFALKKGVGPIWYMNGFADQPKLIPALYQLANTLNDEQKKLFQEILPFLDQWDPARNFYWEREWRHKGDFYFSRQDVVLGICPSNDINFFEQDFPPIRFFDPAEGLDKVIAKLASR